MPVPPYPPSPNPRTWVSGPVLTPSLRADVAENVTLLASRPLFAGQDTLGGSVTNATDQAMAINSELVDSWNGHASIGGSGAVWQNYYCQLPGYYLARSVVPWAISSTVQFAYAAGFSWKTAGITVGPFRGEVQLAGYAGVPAPQSCDIIPMSATGPVGGGGDYIQFTSFQDTGGTISLETSATQLPTVTIRWISALSGTAGLPVPANAAWPVPPSYVTSAFLNANIRDTVRFLTYPPLFRAYYLSTSGLSMASGTFPAGVVVPCNTVTADTYGGYSTSAYSYTAPVAGIYFFYGQWNLSASSATTGYCAGLRVNGGTVQWGGSVYKVSDSTGGGASVAKRLRLNAGDVVQLMGCQGAGSSIGYNGASVNQTRFLGFWESS